MGRASGKSPVFSQISTARLYVALAYFELSFEITIATIKPRMPPTIAPRAVVCMLVSYEDKSANAAPSSPSVKLQMITLGIMTLANAWSTIEGFDAMGVENEITG
jgi:hypothetical protein